MMRSKQNSNRQNQKIMKPIPVISSITIFPIKSLDGISVSEIQTTLGGSLHHDREFALTDKNGNFLIGKTEPLIHQIRVTYDLEKFIVTFWKEGTDSKVNFHLLDETEKINQWLSDFLGRSVILNRNTDGRFLDIPDLCGITILSQSSLEEIANWFPENPVDEIKKRFRANLIIEGVDAFWEDHLFSEEGNYVQFKIGDVELLGISPRERCVVPTRNPVNGKVTKSFAKIFGQNRAKQLPDFSKLDEFGHYYFLTVNVLIPPSQRNKTIKIGDKIEILKIMNEEEAEEYLES